MNQERMDIRESIFRVLAGDVMQARKNVTAFDSEANRRNLLRTIISAVEGISWEYRTYIRSIANDLSLTTPLMELAFSEASYSVTDSGELIEQTRFISTTAMIRLTTKVAASISRNVDIEFGSAEWGMMKDAIRMRNRITHPKSKADLVVSAEDIGSAESAFYWLLAAVVDAMGEALRELANYNVQFKQIAEDLNRGDAHTWAEYRRAVREVDD